MKFLLSFLTALTIGQGSFNIVELANFSINSNKNYEILEYEAMNRAALTFGTKVRQSYFDQKDGITTWTGNYTDPNNKKVKVQGLSKTKMNSQMSGPTKEVAYVYKAGTNKNTTPLDVSGKTIFYGDDKISYYFDDSKIYKFEWLNDQPSNYGLVGGLGGIIGGVGGILGGVGGILGGVGQLLLPSAPKPKPITGSEQVQLEVYNRSIKSVKYNSFDNSLIYSTLDDNGKDWQINKIYINKSEEITLASGTSNYGNYPIVSIEDNSSNTYFMVDGEVSIYREEKTENQVEVIANIEKYKQLQAYNIFVDTEGMYIGLSESKNTNFEAHESGEIKKTAKTLYIDRSNDEVSYPSDGDGYIRDVQWVNRITKYVIYDSKTIVKSNSYSASKYIIDGTKLNPNLTVRYEDGLPRYSGMFDYGVMYQADETYKTVTAKNKPTTDRAQVNRVFNDKFQETLRSSNLIGANSLDWSLGSKGEVYIWNDVTKSNNLLKLTAKSYITKVLLVHEGTETPVENGVIYNKISDDEQYWEIKTPDEHDREGYDLYVQFFDEEKQPNNVITSILKLRPTDSAKIDLANAENSIEGKINPSNEIKDTEILASLSKVTETKITNEDVTIKIQPSTYEKDGEIQIEANPSSKLVMNQQKILIPHLVYDISKTKFTNEDTDRTKIVNTIVAQSINGKSQLTTDLVENQLEELKIANPAIGKNGSISVKAKESALQIKGEQTIILPATNAIDLSKLDFNKKPLSNTTSDAEIIQTINELIKENLNQPIVKVEINADDIDIERVKSAKVGEEGYIVVKAKPVSINVSNFNTFTIQQLKYNLEDFKIADSSNLTDKNEILRRLKLITGLSSVTEQDFNFKINNSTLEKEGKITLTATDDSKLLQNNKEINVPKILNLNETDLFKDFIFYEDTNTYDIMSYLQNQKHWTNVDSSYISFERVSSYSLKYKITSLKSEIIGSDFVGVTQDNQFIEVDVKPARKDLSTLNIKPLDIKKVDAWNIDGNTNEELIINLKNQIMEQSKAEIKNSDIKYEDLHIELIDRFNFKIVANDDSENYKGSIDAKYYLQYDISEHKAEFKDGIFVNQEDIDNINKLQDALKLQYQNTVINWSETKISKNESGNLIVEGKEETSLYSGKLEVKVSPIQDLNLIINVSSDSIPKNKFNEAGIISIIKEQNSDIVWNQVITEVVIDGDSAKVVIKPIDNSKMYIGQANFDFIKNNTTINTRNNTISILLWILAALNIVAIAIAAIFIKKKKKDEN
ncbi:hypothetical protein [Mesoplasma florum]|uniref:hypothetical protein n=1 Tax=Mesoplasma florum TaxID=2151 RepID=UPI000BE2A1C8|nr:hypothetical protein [Mesoplasma florum]ATI73387.1 hypothetical protein CQZ69_02335 [Mesoplasma florum]AVN61786.1 hypothetical protein CG004_02335 [Mesoplasma florum]